MATIDVVTTKDALPASSPALGPGRRLAVSAYALTAYALFFASISYYFLFLTGELVPKTVDSGILTVGPALPLDLLLIALFGAQHSVMARTGVKRRIARGLPQALERSTYVLASALVLVALLALWQPEPDVVWRVGRPLAADAIRAFFWSGVALAVASTYVISHAELFGLAQARAYVRRAAPAAPEFRLPPLYRVVRHPMHLGMLVALWATPRMTVGHLVLALALTGYVLVGIRFEERDLVRQFGERYRAYQRCVPALLPVPRPSAARVSAPGGA